MLLSLIVTVLLMYICSSGFAQNIGLPQLSPFRNKRIKIDRTKQTNSLLHKIQIVSGISGCYKIS